MGNICGKEEPDSSPPGRVLGSAPPSKRKASVPHKVGGPPRTVGGEGNVESASSDDARRKAADAAEARAKASNKQGGKLQSQLSAQKRQSRTETLKQASAEDQRRKEIDGKNTAFYD